MAVTVSAGKLDKGGAILTGSDSTIYAVFYDQAAEYIECWENIDGTPNQIFQDMRGVTWLHASIDSSDIIHIVYGGTSALGGYRYYQIDTSDDSVLVDDESIRVYDEGLPTNGGCSISIDSADVPHVLFVDSVKQSGSLQDNVYYMNRSGGTWGSYTQVGVRAVKTDAYNSPRLTVCAANDIEAFYYFSTNGDPAWRRKNSGWGSETTYTETSATIGFLGLTATTGDTIYRYFAGASQDIEESDVDTGYNCDSTYQRVSAALVNNSDRYVFYIDSSDDVHAISNTGSGWTDEGAQQTGTYLRVIAEWAYNNENQSGEINYIFDDGTNVYYDSFSLAEGELYYQSAAGALTPAGVLVGQGQKALAGALASAGIIVRDTATARAGTFASAGDVFKLTALGTLTGAFTSAGVLAAQGQKALAGGLASAGELIAQGQKVLAGSFTSAGSVVKETTAAIAGTLTTAGVVAKEAAVSFAGTLTSSGTLSAIKIVLKSLAGTLTTAGDLIKQSQIALSGILSTAGNVVSQAQKVIAGILTPAGTVDAVKIVLKALAGTFTSAGELARQTTTNVAGALTTAGDIVRQTTKSFAGALTSSGTLTTAATFVRSLVGTLVTAGGIVKRPARVLAGTLTSAGTLAKRANKVLTGTLTSAGALATLLGQEFTRAFVAISHRVKDGVAIITSLVSGAALSHRAVSDSSISETAVSGVAVSDAAPDVAITDE